MKKRIAILDRDQRYARSLMEAVNGDLSCPFEAGAFSDTESFRKQSDSWDIILTDPAFCTDPVVKEHSKSLYVLSDGEDQSDPVGIPRIYKFRRSTEIIGEILESCYEGNLCIPGEHRRTGIIGVYSPVHRIGKTGFALTLGQELARNSRVLFIDLEDFAGTGILTEESRSGDMSDVVYLSRQEGDLMFTRLPGIVRKICGMDIIPPAAVPIEISEMGTDWGRLIGRIADRGIYDVIIVDWGNSIRGMTEGLACCGLIFMPVGDGATAKARVSRFEKMLDITGRTDIQKIIRKVKLPMTDPVEEFNGKIGSELFFGPYKNIVRRLIKENGIL